MSGRFIFTIFLAISSLAIIFLSDRMNDKDTYVYDPVVSGLKGPEFIMPRFPQDTDPETDKTDKNISDESESGNILEKIPVLKKALESAPQIPPPLPKVETPRVTSEEVYATALGAMVNIFCEDFNRGVYILGSGAIIHPEGFVLTNGHLAENFSKENVSCILRRGSPAKPFAKAEVFYLPDQSQKIGETEVPEKDAAVLRITGPSGEAVFPEEFPYFEFDPNYRVREGESLYYLGFPTEFLGSITIVQNTTLLFSLGTVESLITLDENFYDAEGAYLKGEISAQRGSSGGIFLEREGGRVTGLFVGVTEGENTSERSQFIFLSPYIDGIFKEDKGMGILDLISSQ